MKKRTLQRLEKSLLRMPSRLLAGLIEGPLAGFLFRNGYHVLKRHFYSPVPEEADLGYEGLSTLPGVLIDDAVLEHYAEVASSFNDEVAAFPLERSEDPHQFNLINGNFMAVDAHFYYGLIRHLKPKRIVEIGCGNSTLLAASALKANALENPATRECKIVAIEPYSYRRISGVPGVEVIPKKVQDVDFDIFSALSADDILFIDSSHVLRSGGDVWYEYCEILPRLSSGVYIHIHDICLPKPYPRVYFRTRHYWNEQYVLQALLTFSSKFKVIWAGAYYYHKYPDKLTLMFPQLELMKVKFPDSEPSSFWIQVRAD
jgi:hypothetical protein